MLPVHELLGSLRFFLQTTDPARHLPFQPLDHHWDFTTTTGKLSYFFQQPDLMMIFGGGIVVLLVYYLIVYRKGRYIPRELVRPVYHPPYSLSPAAIRYIASMGFDAKCLIAGIVNAAVKGCYRIRWSKKGFLALQTDYADFEQLSNDEKSALTFRKEHYWDRFFIANTFSMKTRKMSQRMDTYLKKRYRYLFKRKIGWIAGGAAFSSLVCFLIFGLSMGSDTPLMFFAYFLVLWACILIPAYFFDIAVRDRYLFGILITVLYFVIGITAILYIEFKTFTPFFTPVILPFVAINLFFYRIIPTYTKQGLVVMNEILTFRRYILEEMEAAAKAGMNEDVIHLLPYAMAMDVDDKFTGYFKNMLSKTRYGPYQIFDQIYKNG